MMFPVNFRRWTIAAFALTVLASGCAPTGPFQWVDALPSAAAATPDMLLIQEGDMLHVRVFNQEPLSTRDRVRSDGKITVPVVGEVLARGKKPAQFAQEVQDRLRAVVVAPSVSVTIESIGELKVSVIGEVKNPGIYPLDRGANVLHALAAAGGLSDYADSEKVFVLRRTLPQRVRFRYNELRGASPKSIGFTLQVGDTVVVE
jgi:polysaccharide export outer membrane protein